MVDAVSTYNTLDHESFYKENQMNKQVLKVAGLGIGVVLMVALLYIPSLAEEQHQGHKMHMAATNAPSKTGGHNMHEMHMKKLSQAMKAIDKAVKQVEAGNKEKALVELAEAKKLVLACHKAMTEMHKGKIVNAQCPIMGTKLDPKKVTASLTRTYNGKKIGFCCAGCTSAWDKLTDQQKKEKLGKASVIKKDSSKHQH